MGHSSRLASLSLELVEFELQLVKTVDEVPMGWVAAWRRGSDGGIEFSSDRGAGGLKLSSKGSLAGGSCCEAFRAAFEVSFQEGEVT